MKANLRKTKIVGTIGPASEKVETLKEMTQISTQFLPESDIEKLKDNPYILPKYNPINNVNTINKFGFIPAILYQLKKCDCKKYISKKTIKNTAIVNALFIISPFS